MRDFSLDAYMQVVHALLAKQLPIFGVAKWLNEAPQEGALIRHDVDRRPQNALDMAKAEATLGVFTTYYFRVVGSANNPEIMRAIAELGHEVGYHYEDLALAKGDHERAKSLFAEHLKALRGIVPISTVAMHGSPLSPHNNLDIWKLVSLDDFGLLGEAFITVDYSNSYYFTDTGRAWDSIKTNLRDRPAAALPALLSKSGTDGLLDFINWTEIKKIAFSVHPERWDKSMQGWCFQYAKDFAFNSAKRLIALTR